jgi:hypothetical protein
MNGKPKRKVVVFSPYSGIWPHALTEWQLVKQLSDESFEISVINCGGVLSAHCAVMESYRLNVHESREKKSKICRSCIACAAQLNKNPYQKQFIMKDYISDEELVEFQIFVGLQKAESFPNLIYDGLPIGMLTAYETLIKYKKTSLNLNPDELEHWRTSLFQGLVVDKCTRRILEITKPDTVVIYSPQYAAGSVLAAIAAEMGVSVYFIEGSSNIAERYRALRVWSWQHHGLVNPALDYDHQRNEPDEDDVVRVEMHFKEIEKAESFSVYSPRSTGKFDPRNHFGINKKGKILLAALSSYDEAYSAYVIGGFPKLKYQGTVFSSQFEWIEHTIGWFREHPEKFLIIRLHPRDFPNQRENLVSEQTVIWSNLLKDLPINVFVDYPKDGIALHDYFSHIDAFTTGWSSTALEALYFGIPVVTYDSGMPSYPTSIHLSGNTKKMYFENIEFGLSSGKNLSHRLDVISWLAYSFCKGTIRVQGRNLEWFRFGSARMVGLILKFVNRYLPRISQTVDIFYSEKARSSPDKAFLNELLLEDLPNLYVLDSAGK